MEYKPEELLVHADFIRHIARQMIQDPDQTRDLTQETMLLAITTPPEADSTLPLRQWLAGVVKNLTKGFIRNESRRARREWVTYRPDDVPTPAEIAEFEETRRKVVSAVLALREPFRSAILLRYYRDLKPQEIAKHLDIPLDTVKSRLKRGLEQMRGMLDKEYGGSRMRWCLALAPVVGLKPVLSSSTAALSGLAALGAKLKAVAAAALLLAVSIPLFLVLHGSFSEEGGGGSSRGAQLPKAEKEEPGASAPASLEKRRILPGRDDALVAGEQGFLRGRVVDRSGTPVASAKILAVLTQSRFRPLSPFRFRPFRSRSNEDGFFLLESLPIGEYALTAVHGALAGHAVAWSAGRRLGYDGPGMDQEIVVKPWRSVTGIVRGPEGKPVPRALVTAYAPRPVYKPCSFARTDAHGRFMLKHLVEGHCHILVAAGGLAPEMIEHILTETRDLEIRLSRGPFIHGRITREGKAMEGIKIFAAFDREGYFASCMETTSGSDGRYLLGPLPEGPGYFVYPPEVGGKESFAAERTMRPVKDRSLVFEANFALLPGGSIAGSVTDREEGKPLAGVWVLALPGSDDSPVRYENPREVMTDEEGRFLFFSLPPGDYVILAGPFQPYVPALWEGGGKVAVVSGKRTEDIHLRLEKGAVMNLLLHDREGRPVSGARIEVESMDTLDPIGEYVDYLGSSLPAEEAKEGTYRIEGLCEGTFRVTAKRRGWQSRSMVVTIRPEEAAQEAELTLSPAFAIHGIVRDPRGDPVPGVSLSFSRGWNLFADSEGRFTLPDMQAGDGWISVNAGGFLDLYRTVTFREGMPELDLALLPEGPHFIAGTAKDEQGKPVEGMKVVVEQNLGEEGVFQASRYQLRKEALTGRDGRFRIEGLLDRPVTPSFSPRAGYVMENFADIPVDTDALRVTVGIEARILGRVMDGEGNPADRFEVYVEEEGAMERRAALTLDQGRFIVEIPPGTYVLSVHLENGGYSRTAPIAVGPGEVLDDVVLHTVPSSGGITGYVRDGETLAPVQGASVAALLKSGAASGGPDAPTTTTGGDGSFTLHGLKPALYRLETTHPDYSPAMRAGIAVREARLAGGVEILLSRGCRLSGFVLRDGRRLAGVPIEIAIPGREETGTATGEDGSYSIDRLPPGAGKVTATLPLDERTVARVSRHLLLREGEGRCDFQFGICAIQGRVFDSGKPAGEAEIRATRFDLPPREANGGEAYLFRTRSFTDGTYRLQGLGPGRYDVACTCEGREGTFTVRRAVFVEKDTVEVDFHVNAFPSGKLNGEVLKGGLPFGGVQVVLEGDDPHFRLSSHTDENGLYRFSHVPAGVLRLLVPGAEEDFFLTREVRLEAGAVLRQDVSVPAGTGTITGRIRFKEGTFDEEVRVTARTTEEWEGDGIFASTLTRGGRFRLAGLPPGTYRVTVENPWKMARDVRLEPGGEREIEFSCAMGSAFVAGKVWIQGWDPGEEIRVFLLHPDVPPFKEGGKFTPPTLDEGLVREAVLTPSSGTVFQFSHLPDGPYEVAVVRVRSGVVRNVVVTQVLTKGNRISNVEFSLSH